MNALLLEGVVGSTAYGLATPASDTDYAAIWRSLRPVGETYMVDAEVSA